MRPSVYWINAHGLSSGLPEGSERTGRLAIMARPRAGDWLEDEVAGWKAEGIDTVVSLLERDEITELGLGEEGALCGGERMEFISFPIPDRGVPDSAPAVRDLARSLANKLREGNNVAVHCRAGIGRSSLVAACVMISGGSTAQGAFDQISAVRGVQVPDTEEQRAWVERFQAKP